MKQLLFISSSTRVLNVADLKAILHKSREYNQTHQITGVLFYIFGKFLTCIEGEDAEVDQLVGKIRADERYTAFTILSSTQIGSRSFSDWRMGFITSSIKEFSTEDGFFSLDDDEHLDELATRNRELIDLVRAYYKS